ncbi:rhomboid family intramembrane serine protease, partial [Campylobacter jejuni]|nr:rhomboid family intramembrane serine protease [Campylobacter jejuni]ECC0018039.1 rhomboid family intramembrane serine protease [Campylobacter jejuni]ECH4101722.1 rhomboid family intramembrane serine protease [Campylobacter jejuni]MBT0851495.1 rhomboid family intramembrane serine protease [Campylobacter jejuni]HBD8778991.1 rhomboid family intramembrane serine protease [Campylobacter jejuni]
MLTIFLIFLNILCYFLISYDYY